jgi:hypothetical protein
MNPPHVEPEPGELLIVEHELPESNDREAFKKLLVQLGIPEQELDKLLKQSYD